MTTREAIEILNELHDQCCQADSIFCTDVTGARCDAVDMAIKALEAQPDGISLEWIDKHLEWLDNCDNDFAQLAKVGIKAMVEIWKKDKI